MILAALTFAACGGTESNGVVNTTNNNGNRPVSNNTAVVVPDNTNSVVSTTNNGSVTNIWANANGVTREQYNSRRAEYEKDRGTSNIGQGANDSWIWFKTRAALATTNDLRESTVNVDVVNDVVTLKGTVETAAQKTKAEQVAKGIEGVKSVTNQLQVKAGDSMTNQMTDGKNTNSNMNKR
jgi:hypothetical protein